MKGNQEKRFITLSNGVTIETQPAKKRHGHNLEIEFSNGIILKQYSDDPKDARVFGDPASISPIEAKAFLESLTESGRARESKEDPPASTPTPSGAGTAFLNELAEALRG